MQKVDTSSCELALFSRAAWSMQGEEGRMQTIRAMSSSSITTENGFI
jgi:hypothetical protein